MKAGEVESSNLAIAYHLRYLYVLSKPLPSLIFICYSSHTFCCILLFFLRYSLFDGEMSLWTLKAKYDLYLVEMQKYNKTAAKTSVLDSFLIHLLIGLPCKFAIFE